MSYAWRYLQGSEDKSRERAFPPSGIDAILELDSIDARVIEKFIEGRTKHYKDLLSRIANLTILDPDPDSRWKHKFMSDCYQTVVQKIINIYRK